MITTTFSASGQMVVEGRVVDEDTGEPLVFVNIVYNERGTGTTTGIDGTFSFRVSELPAFLKLSYIGYEPVTLYPENIDFATPLHLEMKKTAYEFEELKVVPGYNPAHRIIELAFRNRRQNNPEMLPSFSYTSYNKLFFTLVPDSLLSDKNTPDSPEISIRFSFSREGEETDTITSKAADETLPDTVKTTDSLSVDTLLKAEPDTVTSAETERADSGGIEMREFLEKQHLFLMESVSQRAYMGPGRNNERVIASRVSGFSDPSFTLLATQIQSFSFYEDFISIFDKKYLNPISRGSTSRYSFILEDSMFTERDDTLFIISFSPYPDRNFEGLQGVLYINSNGYAVQNVIAEPYKPARIFTIRIHQNYRFADNRQWFPYQLNTDIILGQDNVSTDGSDRYTLVGLGNSYLSDVEIEPELRRRDFNHVDLAISPDAHKQTEELWDKYRYQPLSEKDRETYRFIDSIGEEAGFDRTLRILETLVSGYIPWGVVNIDYRGLLDFNYYEGLRPGFRFVTNEHLSERFSAGGYVAWGTKDREFKFGGQADLLVYRPADLKIGFIWSKDLEERGGYDFLHSGHGFSSESYRRFMVGRMDRVEKHQSFIDFRMMRHLKNRVYLSSSDVLSTDDYIYYAAGTEKSSFHFTEAGIRIRLAWRERFTQTPRGTLISMGTDYPVLLFNYARGIDLLNGEYGYSRMEGRLEHTFHTTRLGKTSIVAEAGVVDGDVPLQKLYTGKSNFRDFSLEAANSFATMRMGEFVSNEFISLFFRQDFESLLFRKGNFRPEIIFVTSIGYGRLPDNSRHLNVHAVAPEKGFFESGVVINNLYRQLFVGYGLGIYYRYGSYSFPEVFDNFAFKLAFSVNL